MLCLVTGVSGSGKSTPVEDTLTAPPPSVGDAPEPLPYDEVVGDGQINDVILVDQSPIGRSPRSNPVTSPGKSRSRSARLAATVEARTRFMTASHFSFNLDAAGCGTCQGDGHLQDRWRQFRLLLT